MIVFHHPTPISQNPDRYRIDFTARGNKDELTAGRSNWIEVPDQEIEALEAWVVENDALVLASLLPYQRAAISRVNKRIGEIRAKFVTVAEAQDMIYLAKEAEAKAFIAELVPPPNLLAYPFIAQEIGITGQDAYEIAQIWLNMAAQWRQVAAGLENIRLFIVKLIEEATDLVSIASIEASFFAQVANL